MIDYFTVFPQKCQTELRTVSFSKDPTLPFPAGTYIFSEYFCPELDCDCQRVLVKVLYVKNGTGQPKEVATIGYTWNEDAEGWKDIVAELPNPYLDPLHHQASFADGLLEFWHDMLQRDSSYAARLERHYHELRAAQVGSPKSKRIDEPHASMRPSALSKTDRRSRSRLLQQKTKNSRAGKQK